MKTPRVLFFLASALFAFSLLCGVLTPFVPTVGATGNTCTWTGSSSNNFNDASNWSSCGSTVPGGGDNLVFPASAISGNTTLTNDISSLSVGSITFSGSFSSAAYTITGNAITVNGNITDAINNVLDLDVTLGADIAVSGSTITGGSTFGKNGGTVRTLDTNGHTLTFSGSGASCGQSVFAKLAGSGGVAVNLSGGGVRFETDATSFTGVVSATSGIVSVNSPNAFGSTSGVVISGSATLGLALNGADRTYTFPVNLGGSGINGYFGTLYATKSTTAIACAGGGQNATFFTATMTGSFTLSSDINYVGDYVNTNATGTFGANGHSITVPNTSVGTITTSAGTVTAPKQTITVVSGDNQPNLAVNIYTNVTYIIDGVRGDTYVGSGGTLEGTGTVGVLTVAGGGTLAPGHSPGCLTSGNLSLGGTYQAELGGATACSGYDQQIVNGTVTFDSELGTPKLDVSFYNGYRPAVGTEFTIINNDGADAVSGTFNGLPEGTLFNGPNGSVFQITYKGGDGNDVALIVKTAPTAPDTGLAYLQNRPLLTLFVTITITGAVIMLARIYNKRMHTHA